MKLKLTIESEKNGFRRSLEVDSELLVHRILWSEINALVDHHVPDVQPYIPRCPHDWEESDCIHCIAEKKNA